MLRMSCLAVTFSVVVSAAGQMQAAVIPPGRIAHYGFDGTSGAVIDSHGTYHGTNYGATRGVPGKTGNAFQFDGYNDFVDTLPRSAIPTVGTYGLWVKPAERAPFSGGTQILGSIENASGGKDGLAIIWTDEHYGPSSYGNPFAYSFSYQKSNAAYGRIQGTPGSLPMDAWTHLALTMDASRNAKIYVNGVLNGQSNIGVTPNSHDRALMFGKTILSQNLAFDGLMDDVMIWDRALSAEEVAGLTGGPSPKPPQRVYLAFGEEVPVGYKSTWFGFGKPRVDRDGSMSAADLSTTQRQQIADDVATIFERYNVEFVSSAEGAAVVYFTDETIARNPLGHAYTGIDQFNKDREGAAVVFVDNHGATVESCVLEELKKSGVSC